MNIVDSCGWLEYFAEGQNADFFAAPLEDIENLLVPSICILEVFKRIFHQRGEDAALQAAVLMQQGQIVDLDSSIAIHAAKLSNALDLPLADSVILATARLHNAGIWTQDAGFEHVTGVRYKARQ